MMKVLVVCYVFPPSPGIGGRRWAKFAKYLSRNGASVSVLSAKPAKGASSPWSKDLQHADVSQHYFDAHYPQVLSTYPTTIFRKLEYRYWIMRAKIQYSGNYYDRSINCKQALQEKILEIYQTERFDKLIVSAGPFAYLNHVLELKPRLDGVQFVADFRDPWTNNKTAYGFANLPSERLSYERGLEDKVVKGFDRITTVSFVMSAYFEKFRTDGVHSLPNGYDPEDFEDAEMVAADPTTIVFVGTVYDKSIDRVSEFLHSLPREIQVHFYGDSPQALGTRFKGTSSVHFHGIVPLEVAHQKIRGAGFVMLALTEDINYSFSTKFCEYVAMEKKIIVCSNDGSTARFITEQHIGFHFEGAKDKTDLLQYLQQPGAVPDYAKVKEKFNVVSLTTDLEQLLCP